MPATSPIVRVFQATVRPGKEDEFRRFFTTDAVSLVTSQPGCLDVQVGLPTPDTPRKFLMISTWSDLEALVGFAGDQWDQAVIDPRERHLLESTEVEHYLAA